MLGCTRKKFFRCANITTTSRPAFDLTCYFDKILKTTINILIRCLNETIKMNNGIQEISIKTYTKPTKKLIRFMYDNNLWEQSFQNSLMKDFYINILNGSQLNEKLPVSLKNTQITIATINDKPIGCFILFPTKEPQTHQMMKIKSRGSIKNNPAIDYEINREFFVDSQIQMYTKPEYRNIGVASLMLKSAESNYLKQLKTNSGFNPDKQIPMIVAHDAAFYFINKHADYLYPKRRGDNYKNLPYDISDHTMDFLINVNDALSNTYVGNRKFLSKESMMYTITPVESKTVKKYKF